MEVKSDKVVAEANQCCQQINQDGQFDTGWPKSKFPISNSCISETMQFWPHVEKTKSGLKSGGIFLKL